MITDKRRNEMKTLTYGQNVYATKWGKTADITVFTLEGYCAKNNSDFATQYARSEAHGFANGWELAGTSNSGSCITSDKAHHERWKATPLEEGEHVMIEGKEYVVKLVQEFVSDPIHFVPVQQIKAA